MEIENIRRRNLRLIIDRDFDGNMSAFAKAVKKADSQIYRIFNEGKNGRPLSSKDARMFELTLSLDQGFLDQMVGTSEVRESRIEYSDLSTAKQQTGLVPLISSVQAGAFDEAIDIYTDGYAEEYVTRINGGKSVYALCVEGESMTSPTGLSFPEGYIIHVDPEQSCVGGDCVIAKLNGKAEVTFKQLKYDSGKPYLKPLNPTHPPIFDEFKVIGKVIGASIKL